MRVLKQRNLLLMFALLGSQLQAEATTLGGVPGGPVASATGAGGYEREWVPLTLRGGLLIGLPNAAPLRVVAVYAPGQSDRHVIVRWLEREDGKTSILLAAPDELASAARRVTLYFDSISRSSALYELSDGAWSRHEQHPMMARGLDQSSGKGSFSAFAVARLGPYWVVEGEGTVEDGGVPLLLPAMHPLGETSWVRGLSNWILPLVLLAGVWSTARRRHHVALDGGQGQ